MGPVLICDLKNLFTNLSFLWSTDSSCHYNDVFPSDEMSLITNNIKSILNIKIKTRHDSYTDQYLRIFMVKMCVVSSLVMGVDWFHDTVSCMVPQKSDLKPNFIHSACWIQGILMIKINCYISYTS